MGGIAVARRNSERKPGNRRESVLPEEVVEDLLRRPPKPFMRPTRALTTEDIAARIAAESSGEDEPTSDSYYLQLHDLEQAKKEHAERGVRPCSCGPTLLACASMRCYGMCCGLHAALLCLAGMADMHFRGVPQQMWFHITRLVWSLA